MARTLRDSRKALASAALTNDREMFNGGNGWLEVECNRCKTGASLPRDVIRRPQHLAHLEA